MAERYRGKILLKSSELALQYPEVLTRKENLAASACDVYADKFNDLICSGNLPEMRKVHGRWQAVVDSIAYISAKRKLEVARGVEK